VLSVRLRDRSDGAAGDQGDADARARRSQACVPSRRVGDVVAAEGDARNAPLYAHAPAITAAHAEKKQASTSSKAIVGAA
jgi:hypothetical protein